MPEVDGYEVCRKLKANPETTDIPIIFLSAGTEPENLIKGFNAGAVDYITKPFNLKELITRINNHIELKKARDIIRKQNEKLKKVNEELDQTNIELIQSSIQLSVSEAKFRKLFEQSNDGIIIHSVTGKILEVNTEACRMLKYNKKEMLKKPLLSFFNKNTMKSAIKSLIKIRELGAYRFESKLKRADNKIIDIESNSKVIDKEKGIVQSIFRDITQSKLIKTELRKSVRYFRNIYDNIPYSILTIKNDGTILDANLATLEMFDLSGFDNIVDKKLKSVAFLLQSDFIMDFNKFIEKGVKKQSEYYIKVNNKKELWISVYFIPLKDFENWISSSYVILENITNRKKAEQEIRKLSTVIEQNPSSIIITDINGTIEYVNLQFTRLTGYASDEVIDENPGMLQSHKMPVKTYIELWNLNKAGKIWKGQFLNRKKNGDEYWEKTIVAPIYNKNGELINFVSIKEDITKNINTLKALKAGEDKFKKLSNLTFEGILIHDKGVAIDLNLSFANMIAYTYDVLIGKNLLELLIPEEYHTNILQKIDAAYIKPYEYEIIKKNGTRVPVETESRNVVYKGRKVRVTAFRDITERKKTEMALIDSKSKLKEAQKIARLGHWHLNIKENKLEWSDEVYRIFEVNHKDFKNTYEAFLSSIHPDDIDDVNKAYYKSVKNKTEYNNYTQNFIKKR